MDYTLTAISSKRTGGHYTNYSIGSDSNGVPIIVSWNILNMKRNEHTAKEYIDLVLSHSKRIADVRGLIQDIDYRIEICGGEQGIKLFTSLPGFGVPYKKTLADLILKYYQRNKRHVGTFRNPPEVSPKQETKKMSNVYDNTVSSPRGDYELERYMNKIEIMKKQYKRPFRIGKAIETRKNMRTLDKYDVIVWAAYDGDELYCAFYNVTRNGAVKISRPEWPNVIKPYDDEDDKAFMEEENEMNCNPERYFCTDRR